MDHNIETCPLKIKLEKLEQDHNDLHANLQLSAHYGNTLLEEKKALMQKITEIQTANELSIQENHFLKMQLEVSQKSHLSQTQEMETIKESLQRAEEINQQRKVMDEEQSRKESSLMSQILNLKEQTEASKEIYELKIKELESEVKSLKSIVREPVQMSCNHDEEISQLQLELELAKQSKSTLEEEIVAKQSEIQQFHMVENQLTSQVSQLEYEILNKEKALASSEKLLEEKRVEILEFQALLEAEKVSQTNPEKRGNSIFSEVEDRRQQVERHLTKLTTLLDKEKRKNQDLQAEIVKVKNQMAFMACGANSSESSKSVEHLENLLRSTTNQNEELLKKIEELEKKTRSAFCSAAPPLEDSRKWMQAMLAQKQEENDKLRAEIRDHIRSSLCETDRTMQLTKRLAEAEKNLQRARAEVYRLKVKIDEMANNENIQPDNASPLYTTLPTRVVENLKFVFEKKETISSQPEKPLRERVVLQNHQPPPPPQLDVDNNVRNQSMSTALAIDTFKPTDQDRTETDVTLNGTTGAADDQAPAPATEPSQSAMKRQVRMNNEVHVVYEDGDTTLETLADDKFTAGAKKTTEKPAGHQVEIVDATKPESVMECNQQ